MRSDDSGAGGRLPPHMVADFVGVLVYDCRLLRLGVDVWKFT